MPNNYYERLSEMNPGELADGLAIEQEFDAIGRGFSKLPDPHRDGGGFEGPTRVGDPVEKYEAVNLGSLEKLNLPIYRKKITTEDWNTLTTAGIYDVVNSVGDNKPPTYNFGVLHVYSFNGVVSQIYYPDNNDQGVLAKRTCKNVSTNSWLSWEVLFPAARVTTLVPTIYPSGAPHDAHETVVPELPANIVNNFRYVLPNPFGINTRVDVTVELYLNGKWAGPGHDGNTGTGNSSVGVSAFYVQGEGIVIQTGTNFVSAQSSLVGGGHGVTSNSGTISAPCRVAVREFEG